MPIKSNREYRNMVMRALEDETEEKESMKVTGYASTFNDPYTLFEDDDLVYREQVASDAFEDADMSDVIMQYDHEGRVFARVSNNTLAVSTDDKGLLINADLGGTELGRQLYNEIRGGYTDKMSFGFTVDDDAEESYTDEETGKRVITRTITKIGKLYDVSAVSIPANDATEISVRNLTDGAISQIKAERLEAEKLALDKARLELRARALSLSGGNK